MKAVLAAASVVAVISCATRGFAADETTLATTPESIVLGDLTSALVEVRGIGGTGTIRGDVNVGTIGRLEEPAPGHVRVHFRLPAQRSPQVMCLLLWREAGPDTRVHVFRVPMLASTVIPVQTRRNSEVKIVVGQQAFGPFPSGNTGRLQPSILVPPGVREAWVHVTDTAGLEARRPIAIRSSPYNQLAVAMVPGGPDSPLPRLRVTVGTAEDQQTPAMLQVGTEFLPMTRAEGGAWTALWAPTRRPPEGPLSIAVWLPDRPESRRYAQVHISPARFSVETMHVRPTVGWKRAERLGGAIGVSVGMVHNFGELTAPRVGVELGMDYPLPRGRIGLRLFAAFAYSSQRVPGRNGLAEADASLVLLPFGGGVTYRLPAVFLSPYVFAGAAAQLVRSSSSAEYVTERLRHDWALGVIGLAGVEPRLGPGRVFLQTGYLFSRVENQDIEVLAGGLVLEGGYRLDL
jgi:hypothetical protein